MVKKKGKQRKAQAGPRIRNEFTATEDDNLVEYLAAVAPASRLAISIYRAVANEPWGSTHSDESWASRYRRYKATYDVRIDAFLEARENEQSGPRRKKRRLCFQSADSDETFPEPTLSFARFQQHAAQLTKRDQFLGLSLAIDLLSAKHRVEPEVAYATWERCGDLRLADKELEEERKKGDDAENDGEDENDERVHSSPEPPESEDDTPPPRQPAATMPTSRTGKRRPHRRRDRTHSDSDLDFVPSSVPSEEESMVQQRVETPPRPRRQPSSPSARSTPSPPRPDIDANDDNKALDSEDDDAATALLLLQPSPASILQPQPRWAPVAFALEAPLSPSPEYIQTQRSLFGPSQSESRYIPTQTSLFSAHFSNADDQSQYIPTQTSLFGRREESQYIPTQTSLFGSHLSVDEPSQYIPTQTSLFGRHEESQYIPTQKSLFG
ncbi:hypothetical protein C8R46DRAFT_1351307 [Mycena filopes]|nr:hypothetical protein C8R46DRAFT_1351307 [Mycena filopes]